MTKTKVLICPYCGETQTNAERCRSCGGLFEPLSRQATHNAMGPWFVRDAGKPFHPGCSYETLVRMIDRGQVTKYSIIRGPTTKQFWTVAKHVPGVAHLLGYCHNCDASVDAGDHGCHVCGVPFGAFLDRNYLGLPDVRPLPWDADMEGAPEGSADAPGGLGRSQRGISGFASDDELLGSAGRMHHPISSSSATSESVFEDHASPITTALRRKLESQHRTIRTLTILFFAVVIMSALAVLALSRRTSTAAPATGPQTPVANAATPAPPQEQAPAPAKPEKAPAPVPSAAPKPPDEAAPPAADPAVAARTKAQQLIASAAREDLPIEERIADLQAALDALKTAAATPAEIAEVERELERLTLQKNFFGSD